MNSDPTFKLIKENPNDVYHFLKKRVKAYKTLGKSATDLREKIDAFEQLVAPIRRHKRSPLFVPLAHFDKKLATVRDKMEAFLKKEQNQVTSAATRPPWKIGNTYKIKRAFFASSLQDLFEETSVAIDHEITVMNERILMAERISTLAAYRFYADMSEPAFEFWTDICGVNLTSLSSQWSYFITSYKVKYPMARRWGNETISRMKTIACVDGDDNTITIGGFILLTNICGFPLDPSKLPSLSAPLPDAAARLKFSRNIKNYGSLRNH